MIWKLIGWAAWFFGMVGVVVGPLLLIASGVLSLGAVALCLVWTAGAAALGAWFAK